MIAQAGLWPLVQTSIKYFVHHTDLREISQWVQFGMYIKGNIINHFHHSPSPFPAQHNLTFLAMSSTVYLDNPPPKYGDQARSFCRHLPSHIQSYFSGSLPIIHWLPRYNLAWATGDLLAAITLGAVVVPQSMAYGMLRTCECICKYVATHGKGHAN